MKSIFWCHVSRGDRNDTVVVIAAQRDKSARQILSFDDTQQQEEEDPHRHPPRIIAFVRSILEPAGEKLFSFINHIRYCTHPPAGEALEMLTTTAFFSSINIHIPNNAYHEGDWTEVLFSGCGDGVIFTAVITPRIRLPIDQLLQQYCTAGSVGDFPHGLLVV